MSNSNETLLAYFQGLAREQPDHAEWARGALLMEEFISLTQRDEADKQAIKRILVEAGDDSGSCGSAWTDMTLRIQNFARVRGLDTTQRG